MGWDVQIARPCDLDWSTLAEWAALRDASPLHRSPFHSPDWFVSLSHFLPNVRVLVARRGQDLSIALPFDDLGDGRVRAAGGWLSDEQGFVLGTSVDELPLSVMRRAGLRRWLYDHVPHNHPGLGRSVAQTHSSPYLDVSSGFDAYLSSRTKAGSSLVKWQDQARKMLEREAGELRFEANNPDPGLLTELMRWKSAQYQKTGAHDLFSESRIRDLIGHVVAEAPGFGARLSVLWAGERPAALHLGPCSATTWHWWFPAYDPDLGRGSPGALHLLETARYAATKGIATVELGRGDETYKKRMANGDRMVVSGQIHGTVLRRVVQALRHRRSVV